MFVDNRYVSPDTWYDREGKAFQPGVHYYVGGATKLYGAALYRLREEDFGELRHHDGLSPAWPISYDELEPYYTLAEQLYQVHGARGEDPTEPPASAPYPHPPSRTSRGSSSSRTSSPRPAISRSTRRAGSCSTRRTRPFSTCIRCATCDGFPCLVHAKSDAEVLGVRPALEHPNVTLLTDAKVVRLGTDQAGTAVTEVVVDRDGAEERFTADVVVVSCGAANTPSCSCSRRTTGTRTVSRTAPTRSAATTCSTTRPPCSPSPVRRTRPRSRRRSGLNDFYFGADDFEYPLGNVQMVGKSQAAMFRGERPRETQLAPEWTLERMAKHAIDFWLSTEDLPRPDNRVTVDREGNITLAYTETNAEAKKQLYTKVKSLLGKLDMNPDHLIHRFAYMKNDIPIAGCAHQAGTCRFGTDEATSVLDTDCKAHELDNLYVVDTSFFPASGR